MAGYLGVVGLALLAAIAVIAVANAARGGSMDLRGFWRDFRSGLRRRGAEDEPAGADVPEPVDVPFDQLFAEVSQPDDGYLQLDELAGVLERTGERASRLRGHLPQSRTGTAPGHPARRSGHVPVGRVRAPAAPAAPPAVPPQRSDG
jgi:hypothetical protein